MWCSDHEGGNVSAHAGHLVSYSSYALSGLHLLTPLFFGGKGGVLCMASYPVKC
jgi:hypothetical protein